MWKMGEKATRGKNMKLLGYIFAIKFYSFEYRLAFVINVIFV